MNDFNTYMKNTRAYSGVEEKFGITIGNNNYIVKFQINSDTGLLNNHFSEHIGSNIFSLLGEEAQSTLLGLYKGRAVVLCEDFIGEDEIYIPFNSVLEATFESRAYNQNSYDDIIDMLKENIKITNINEVIEKF